MLISMILILLAFGILIALTIIDFRTWLLPDPLTFSLAVNGILFHIWNDFTIISEKDMICGALLGAGLLYAIRLGGNAYYKQESLGLGDVKLLGVAGLWLGVEGTLMTIVLGAAAGIVYGVIWAGFRAFKNKTPYSLKRLTFPAGPGFCAGMVLAGLWIIGPYFGLSLPDID